MSLEKVTRGSVRAFNNTSFFPNSLPNTDSDQIKASKLAAFEQQFKKFPGVYEAILSAANEFGINPLVMMKIAEKESSGNPLAQSKKYIKGRNGKKIKVPGNYFGVFQLDLRTYGRNALKDPLFNARMAAKELKYKEGEFIKEFKRNPMPTELYAMHQQGIKGGPAIIRNPHAIAASSIKQYYKNSQSVANSAIWGNMKDYMKVGFKDASEVTGAQFLALWAVEIEGQDYQTALNFYSSPNNQQNTIFAAATETKTESTPAKTFENLSEWETGR